MYYAWATGDDANPGTIDRPRRDPSRFADSAIWLRRGDVFQPQGRVTLQSGTGSQRSVIGAYGDGAAPILYGRDVVDIGVSAINAKFADVQDVEIAGYAYRGVHVGVTGEDASAQRSINLRRVSVRDIVGPGGIGVQAWGAGIVYEGVSVDRVRVDCLWHCGVDFVARNLTLARPSIMSEGGGDCLQVSGLRTRLSVSGLVAVKTNTADKQAALFEADSNEPLAECVVDDLRADGMASGAGLVTLNRLRNLNGRNWSLALRGGSTRVGVAGLNGARATIFGGACSGAPVAAYSADGSVAWFLT